MIYERKNWTHTFEEIDDNHRQQRDQIQYALLNLDEIRSCNNDLRSVKTFSSRIVYERYKSILSFIVVDRKHKCHDHHLCVLLLAVSVDQTRTRFGRPSEITRFSH